MNAASFVRPPHGTTPAAVITNKNRKKIYPSRAKRTFIRKTVYHTAVSTIYMLGVRENKLPGHVSLMNGIGLEFDVLNVLYRLFCSAYISYKFS